VPGGRR